MIFHNAFILLRSALPIDGAIQYIPIMEIVPIKPAAMIWRKS
jgi:hypothetical protein